MNIDKAKAALVNAHRAGDVEAARKLANAIKRAETKPTLGGAATFAARGANVGLADMLGAPVDLVSGGVNLASNALGFDDVFERPVGGSEHLRSLLAKGGIGFESREDVPEEFRPFAAGGEAFGQAIPFAVAPLAAGAKAGVQAVTKGVTAPIVEGARRLPGSFATVEGAGAAGSALGEGIAEAQFPDDPLAQFGFGLIGGLLGSYGVASAPFSVSQVKSGKGAQGVINRIRSAFTKSGKKERARNLIVQMMQDAEENPSEIISMLRDVDDDTLTAAMSSAQKSGSTVLAAVERALARSSREFDSDITKGIDETFKTMDAYLRIAAKSDNPEVVSQALRLRGRMSLGALDEVLKSSKTANNLAAREALTEARSLARETENELWSAVNRDLDVTPQNLRQSLEAASADLLDEETLSLPAPILKALDRLSESESAKSGDLLRLRSRIGREIADQRSKADPDRNAIRQLSEVYSGLTEDLAAADPAATLARDYSRQLNQRFSQNFPAKVQAVDARGGDKIAPERTLEAAGTDTQREINLRDLQGAADFPVAGAAPGQKMAKSIMQDALDSSLAKKGKPDSRLLDAFLRGPEYRRAVERGTVTKAQDANMKRILGRLKRFETSLETSDNIDELIEGLDPFTDLFARVLGSNLGAASGLAQASGSGLVLAHAGSKKMRELLGKVPNARITEMLMEAAKDPRIMADLLAKGEGVKASTPRIQRLNAWLLSKGFIGGQDGEEQR